jgi:hypothetical protein
MARGSVGPVDDDRPPRICESDRASISEANTLTGTAPGTVDRAKKGGIHWGEWMPPHATLDRGNHARCTPEFAFGRIQSYASHPFFANDLSPGALN